MAFVQYVNVFFAQSDSSFSFFPSVSMSCLWYWCKDLSVNMTKVVEANIFLDFFSIISLKYPKLKTNSGPNQFFQKTLVFFVNMTQYRHLNWASHSGAAEVLCLMGHWAVSTGKKILIFCLRVRNQIFLTVGWVALKMKALEFLKPLNWLLTIDKSTQHNNLEQLNNRIVLRSKNYMWNHFSNEEYLQNN